MTKWYKEIYNWYLIFLGFIVSLPIIAPITLYFGLTNVSKIIYFIYSFFCHQFANRSFHLFDYQYAWCSRDTGIWIGIFLTAILIKLGKLNSIKWYWVIPFVIPVAFDGGIQTIFTILGLSITGDTSGVIYQSTNLIRFLTGSIFGIGISLWLSGNLLNESKKIKTLKVTSKTKRSNILKTLLLMLSMFLIYISFILLWDITSHEHDPEYPIDFVVKSETDNFFVRRENAVCETDATKDFLNLECFFGDDN